MSRIETFKTREMRTNGMFVELGRIYKGEPKTDPKRPGKELDYFRVEFNDSEIFNKAALEAAFSSLYGEQPKVIRGVAFLTDNVKTVFSSSFEEWIRNKRGNPQIFRRCDGRTISLHYQDEQCIRTPTACTRQCNCKPTGRLQLWLPEFTRLTGIPGAFLLITHAQNDIEQIYSTLDFATATLGRLTGLPFLLSRVPQMITTPEGIPTLKHLVRLDLEVATAQAAALSAGEFTPQLQATNESVVIESDNPWTDEDMKRFDDYRKQHGYSAQQVQSALGVERLSQWQHSYNAAVQRMENHQ